MIATRKVNTLVLVHRQQLLDQWHARLEMFLNLSKKSALCENLGKALFCGDFEIL
jgi:superfamily II DNA or RNA helicase